MLSAGLCSSQGHLNVIACQVRTFIPVQATIPAPRRTTFNVQSEQPKVQLRLATNEGGKLWLNGKRVWQMFRTEEVPLDHDIVSVVLHPGDNIVLLKVVNSFGDWGFYLRVTDENGKGMPDIEFKAVDGDAAMAKL